MAQRWNHYDAAFEDWLRASRVPYVAVDETRRALLAEASLKSMDFIVYAGGGPNLLIDVKGRRYPSGSGDGKTGHRWENWATADDVHCLMEWERLFGGEFRALLAFVYEITERRFLAEHEDRFSFRGRAYAVYGVWVDEYREQMRRRSNRWETVSLPAAEFRRLRRPLKQLLGTLPPGVGPEPSETVGEDSPSPIIAHSA